MKVLLIGGNPQDLESAVDRVQERWPEALLSFAASGSEGSELVDRISPALVVLFDLQDSKLTSFIRLLRSISDVPLLVLGDREDGIEVRWSCY